MFEQLADRFTAQEIEWRIQKITGKGGMCLAYVDARAIMRRLDEVVGPENWQDKYELGADGVMCGIGIRFGNDWVWKWDGSPATKIESFKGGISKALVRCAVKWGMGRYLYDFPTTYIEVVDKTTPGARWAKEFYWKPPDYDGLLAWMDDQKLFKGMNTTGKAGKGRGQELNQYLTDGILESVCDPQAVLESYGAKEFADLPRNIAERYLTMCKAQAGPEPLSGGEGSFEDE